MKYFPLILHAILTFVAIGAAQEFKSETLNGLAAGLLITLVVRLMVGK